MNKKRLAIICDADYTAMLAEKFEAKTNMQFNLSSYLMQAVTFIERKLTCEIEVVIQVAYGSVTEGAHADFRKDLFAKAQVVYAPFPRKSGPSREEMSVDATIGFQIGRDADKYDCLLLIAGDSDFIVPLTQMGKEGKFIMTVPSRGSSSPLLLKCSTAFPFDTYIEKQMRPTSVHVHSPNVMRPITYAY